MCFWFYRELIRFFDLCVSMSSLNVKCIPFWGAKEEGQSDNRLSPALHIGKVRMYLLVKCWLTTEMVFTLLLISNSSEVVLDFSVSHSLIFLWLWKIFSELTRYKILWQFNSKLNLWQNIILNVCMNRHSQSFFFIIEL